MNNTCIKALFVFSVMILMAFIPSENIMDDIPRYRIVIDPGHGGFFSKDKERNGDRFDIISGRYLDFYAEGANYKGIYEHKLVYSIAQKVINRLSLCSENGNFDEFKQLVLKFSKKEPRRIYIETMISRDESLNNDGKDSDNDPNGPYRLYDYPDSTGEIVNGRISKINSFKPHLVISLHMAETAAPGYYGMNGIIVAPYNVLKNGLDKLRTGKFKNARNLGIVKSWFQESNKLPKSFYYFKDVSQYYTGYGITKKYMLDINDYSGYKYNMVNWAFKDDSGWAEQASAHNDNSRFSIDYKTLTEEEGKFRKREMSVYEEYRRGSSSYNYGGDNYYATYEIIKYILYSLHLNGIDGKNQMPGKPYVSTWSVPLLINAVSAYIELGYFERKWDRDILVHRQDEIADGIAVGVYSLLAGIDKLSGNYRYKPSGKCIDLQKYYITKDKSYFGIVSGNEEDIYNFF